MYLVPCFVSHRLVRRSVAEADLADQNYTSIAQKDALKFENFFLISKCNFNHFEFNLRILRGCLIC